MTVLNKYLNRKYILFSALICALFVFLILNDDSFVCKYGLTKKYSSSTIHVKKNEIYRFKNLIESLAFKDGGKFIEKYDDGPPIRKKFHSTQMGFCGKNAYVLVFNPFEEEEYNVRVDYIPLSDVKKTQDISVQINTF